MGFRALALFAFHVIVASSSPAKCENVGLLQSQNGQGHQCEIQLPAEVHDKPKTAGEVDQTQLLQSSMHMKHLPNPMDQSLEDVAVAPDVAFAGVTSAAFPRHKRCIDEYVMDVKTVLPDYDLSDRRFGGTSGSFPGNAKPPILAPGFGTTGTRSVCELGRNLGLKVHHYSPHAFFNDILLKVDGLLVQNCSERKKLNDFNYLKIMLSPSIKADNAPVDMLMDVPIGELFLDFYAASPDSKVLLTKRDPMKWATERKAYHKNTVLPVQSPCGKRFGELQEDELAKLMEHHHKLVRCMVPAEKLEVDIFQDDDTTKIAEFVGRPQKYAMPMPRLTNHPWMHPHKDKK